MGVSSYVVSLPFDKYLFYVVLLVEILKTEVKKSDY